MSVTSLKELIIQRGHKLKTQMLLPISMVATYKRRRQDVFWRSKLRAAKMELAHAKWAKVSTSSM